MTRRKISRKNGNDEIDDLETSRSMRASKRRNTTQQQQPTTTHDGSIRTRGSTKSVKRTGDAVDRGKDGAVDDKKKRKIGGDNSNTTATAEATTKKKAAAAVTAKATKTKKETVTSSSTKEGPNTLEHLSTQSPPPSALNDLSNTMGRDDIMGRDASGKSSRRQTPSSKQKEWDEMRKNLAAMKSPLRSKNLMKQTRKPLPLPIKKRVRIDEDNNQVKEFSAIDENGADDGSNNIIKTNEMKSSSSSDTDTDSEMETDYNGAKSTTTKKKKKNGAESSSRSNDSSNSKNDNDDTDKCQSIIGAPSKIKDCLSPSSPSLNKQQEKTNKGDNDDKTCIKNNKKEDENKKDRKGDDDDTGPTYTNKNNKENKNNKDRKGDDDDTGPTYTNKNNKENKNNKDRKGDDDDTGPTYTNKNNKENKNNKDHKGDDDDDDLTYTKKNNKEDENKKDHKGDGNDDDLTYIKKDNKEDENRKDRLNGRKNIKIVKTKREDDAKSTVSTKASRAISKALQLQIPQMFDEMIIDDNIKLELLTKIYDKLKHPAIKFQWDEERIADLSDILFPLKHVWLTEREYRSLMRDPKTTLDEYLLYGGYSHIDLATQFTFSKKDDSKWWCPLPASLYGTIVQNKYEKDGGEINNILNRNQMLRTGGLLDYKVLDFIIWGNNHFSRVFAINASFILEPFYSFKRGDDDEEKAFMIHTNSMVGLKAHDTVKIGKNIIRFLNEYIQEHGLSTIRKYNANVFPIVSCNVTQQKDKHSCAYQTLAQQYSAMKAIKTMGPLTRFDFDAVKRNDNTDSNSNNNNDSASTLVDHFKYNQSDVFMIKADLKCIIRCLKKIKQTEASGLSSIQFDFDGKDDNDDFNDCDDGDKVELVNPIKRPTVPRKKRVPTTIAKKQGRENLNIVKKKEQQRKKEVAEERAEKHDGKLNAGQHKNLKAYYKKMAEDPPRRQGEGAATLRSYHDEGHRRSLNNLGKSSYAYQRMCRFVSDAANATMKPASSITLIFNEIAEHPDFSGKNYAPYRTEPQRLCICAQGDSNRDERYRLAKDYYQNFDKYENIDNSTDLDLKVMGDRADARYKSCNDDNLENITRVESSPKNKEQNIYDNDDDEEEVDEKALGF